MNIRILVAFILVIAVASEPLSIQYASTFVDSQSSSLSGSLAGGRMIYIKGLGFDPVAQNNNVFVGQYPCQVPAQGVTTNFLSCETTDSGSDESVDDLEIKVYKGGQKASAPNDFSYTTSDTPYLYDIFPSSSIPGSTLYFTGVHRVLDYGNGERDFGDFIGLYIGNQLCGMFDISQGYINYNSETTVECIQAELQEAGRYLVSEHVTAGYSKSDFKMKKTSASGENYDHTVLPAVESVTPNEGLAGGQTIMISGSGFSTTTSDVSVSVDGVACDIESSSLTEIQCTLDAKLVSDSALLETNAGSQVDGYISGGGWAYARYDITDLSSKSYSAFKTAVDSSSSDIVLIESGVKAQLESTNVYGEEAFGQVWKGYFKAPVDGDYTFRGAADDTFGLYMSDQYGSASLNPTPIISQSSYGKDPDNYYISNNADTLGTPITLAAGKYYYMELYHTNHGGDSWMKISVEVPNTDSDLTWQTHQVNEIDIDFTNEPQIKTFTLDGVTDGTFMLKVYRINPATLEITYDKNVSIAFDASDSAFKSAIRSFDMYSPYTVTVTSAVSGSARTWTAEIYHLRTDAHEAEEFQFIGDDLVGSPVWTQDRTQQHAPLISGTWNLQMGGLDVMIYDSTTGSYSNRDLPYDISASALKKAIDKSITGFENIQIVKSGGSAYGANYLISYLSYNDDVPDLVLTSSGLVGGQTGTSPTVSFSELRKHSTNLLYNPVDDNFMFTASSGPNVLVEVNGLLGVCTNDCAYTFETNVPEITAQTISTSTLTLTISDPLSQNYPASDFTIKLDEQDCTSVSGTMASLTCTLTTNSDGTPTIRAGSHNAYVFIKDVGIVQPQSGLATLDETLSISALAPSSVEANGGKVVVISGTGLPSDKSQVTLTVCGINPKINGINNIEIEFVAPQCNVGTESISLEYDSTTVNANLDYTTATISATVTSITPDSANPALKGVMTIAGSGFGTDDSVVKVYLANTSGKVYEMRILTIIDTQIECGIPGGLPGDFDVVVEIDGLGDVPASPVTANDFTYELTIDSISPTTGSHYGGTLITLTGKNFSPEISETLVSVGDQINWLCSVESITTTQIQCRTPTTHADWTSSTQNIILTNRLILDSTCTSSCSFTYDDEASSMAITDIAPTQGTASTGVVDLTGVNFDLAGSSVSVILENVISKEKTEVTPTASTPTVVAFTIPNVPAGSYRVRTRIDPSGQSNAVLLKVKSALPTSSVESSIKGGLVELEGKGLPNAWPSTLFSMSLVSDSLPYDVDVESTDSGAIVIRLPEGVADQQYTLTLQDPNEDVRTVTITQTTAATPSVSLTTPSSTSSPGSIAVTLNKDSLTSASPSAVKVFNVLNPDEMTSVAITESGTEISFTHTFAGGAYGFSLYYDDYGYADISDVLNVQLSGITATPAISSYVGGVLTVSGSDISDQAVIMVGGMKGKVIGVRASEADFEIPELITSEVISAFPQLSKVSAITPAAVISDGGSNEDFATDGKYSSYYSSTNADCYIGVDLGEGKRALINRVRYFPYSKWTIAAKYIKGAVIEASVDGVTYTQLGTVDQTVHSGWNSIMPTNTDVYRFVRIRHNTDSNCKIAEIQVIGNIFNDATVSSISMYTWPSAEFNDGFNTFTFSNAIEYRQDGTPIITSVTPANGDVFGGYNITIGGSYLDIGAVSVMIDGVECVFQTGTASQIICQVGARSSLPDDVSFDVTIGGNKVIAEDTFIYVLRWSDIRTWGTDLPPVEGDLVYVPKGMTLFVDQSTPQLEGIVVENGKLIFADEGDMQIHAGLITMNGGQFRAGTEDKPYVNKLTFIMYGNYEDGKQIPITGNKGIVCNECKFSMYGKEIANTWTQIASTISVGDTTLTVQDSITDWMVGDSIVVASTDFDHNQAQQKVITAISGNTITVDSAFEYKHFSGVQTFGTASLEMKAEVGLLTRNIKMKGDDETSVENQYGSHLMMLGSAENGMVSHIAYTQFTHCGQPRIVGRYCMHFHMNGDVPDSYVKGNAVHHSFARVITIHAVHYLHVSENVGYRVKGHNFFIEDGIETQNVIEYNLAISSLRSENMMQTDISVASFWVTNPTNHLRYNHAAGGDFYAFWYQIKPHPDGPSATSDICPEGNPVGESHHNVAHSYVRFGLRIFKLSPREIPCEEISFDEVDPSNSANPSVHSAFSDFVTYKIGEAGLLAEETGDMLFENFVIADSGMAGMQYYRNIKTGKYVKAQNMTIIGRSLINPPSDPSKLNNARGVIGPRSTEGWKISDINFYNFDNDMVIMETCSKCNDILLYTNTGQEYELEDITYTNVTSKKIHMLGLKRQIIYDMDGSFSTNFDSSTRSSATIMLEYPHIAAQSACNPPDDAAIWQDTLICDSSLPLRKLRFENLENENEFKSTPMKVQLLADIQEEVHVNSTDFTQIYSLMGTMQPHDIQFSYTVPLVSGRIYNIWWLTGVHWTHLDIDISALTEDSEDAIILKFNYTENRQLFEIKDKINGELSDTLKNDSADPLDATTCEIGQYTHYNGQDNRTMTVCLSSKGKTQDTQVLDLQGIYCRYLCPAPEGQFTKEDFVRMWSNATQWPQGRMPVAGENVTVNGNWTILMDINPEPIEFLKIDGDMIIPDYLNNNSRIEAESIWIRAGSLTVGNSSTPYNGTCTIQINGNKEDAGYVFSDEIVGNKQFVVNGQLKLYGSSPSTTWTRLKSSVSAGDTSIEVGSVDGWAIGDEIVLGPSYSKASEYEKVTITNIVSQTVTFTPALQYNHYGASSATINNSYGKLDARTAVGHITRKIKIIPGPDNGWGYRLLVYGFLDGDTLRTGQVIFEGVQIKEGGQYDTEKTAVQFYNAVGSETSKISSSSFHDCKSFCLDINNARNLKIQDNVFYKGRLFHVRALKLYNYIFEDNLMIGATKRPTVSGKELIACYGSWAEIDQEVDLVTVKDNVCQGSDLHGFALAYVPCDKIDNNPFYGNTAGSTGAAFIFTKISGTCMAASGIRAYASSIAQISSSVGTKEILFKDFITADCGRGATLRFGMGGRTDNHDFTANLQNSYFTAISRPSCTQCYESGALDCSWNQGIRMLAVTVNGESLPDKFGTGYDVICREEQFDSKAFLRNVTFENFNQQYSEAALSLCSNNVVFKSHPTASDITGSHHLHNTTCINCSSTAHAFFDVANQKDLGWQGGCGNILCTGKNNYLVHDWDGAFLGTPGILIANNSEIGENTADCTQIPEINGHHCTRQDFGVLEYESIAPDFNTRIMWPVYLHYDGGNYRTETNGWREWQWQGNEPLNLRMARFVSIVELSKIYNMTFSAEPPIDMRLQFQRRSVDGDNSEFIMVKLYYPRPNSIRVQAGSTTIKPISLLDDHAQAAIDNATCGSNKFFYENYTIHFVVTGDKDCMVRVSLTNSIKLTARFDMDIADFYSIGGQTLFVDRMCALLGVTDTSRLKIVGIYNGSVIVEVYIDEEPEPSETSQENNNTRKAKEMQELNAKIKELSESGDLNENLTSEGFGNILSLSTTLYVIPEDTEVTPIDPPGDSIALIVGIAVGVSALVAMIIFGGLYCVRKRARIEQQVQQLDSEEGRSQNIQKVGPVTSDNLSFGVFKTKE